jgi:hypothetical protein
LKIGIISDTHGCADRWQLAYEKFFKDADMILHAGDILYHGPRNPMLSDYNPALLAERINKCPVPVVFAKGNCDSEVDTLVIDVPIEAPYSHILANGRRIIVTHGHRESEEAREVQAKQFKADLVITGHTHVTVLKKKDGIIFMNPGSPSLSKREDGISTVAVAGDEKIEIFDVDSGKVLMAIDW